MKAMRLTLTDFRNLSRAELLPDGGVNILYGDNAQGKTNLLEALWLFTGGRSFRGAKDADMIRFDTKKAALHLDFETVLRPQTADITIEKRRAAQLNGVPQPAANRLTGHFCAVIFSPHHLSLIKDGPEMRRRFLDAAICQLRPSYMPILAKYSRTLLQRNSLFKSGQADETLLALWDDQLIQGALPVIEARRAYVQQLQVTAGTLYDGLSDGREALALRYGPADMPQEDVADWLREKLRRHRQADEACGCTTAGPHRDNLEVEINERSARQFGSQGQQRSAVLAMKLAEAALLEDAYDDRPVVLLDDVMSELDVFRQDFILNRIRGWQVFITCCDPASVLRLTAGKTFAVKEGTVV